MADPPSFPWLYAYQEDGPRLGRVALRPIVPIRIFGTELSAPVYVLVDSGCDHVLAAPWLADSAGVDPKASGRTIRLGLGGSTLLVEFADVRLRLMAPSGGDDAYFEWDAEVGFVNEWKPTFQMLMGQNGFMDQFTVTPSLFAKHTAVEPGDVFDERFPIPSAPNPETGRDRRF